LDADAQGVLFLRRRVQSAELQIAQGGAETFLDDIRVPGVGMNAPHAKNQELLTIKQNTRRIAMMLAGDNPLQNACSRPLPL
jgi:hypothetical protein